MKKFLLSALCLLGIIGYASADTTYKLVESANDLTLNDEYILVYTSSTAPTAGCAMGASTNSNTATGAYRSKVDCTVNTTSKSITLTGNEGVTTFKIVNGNATGNYSFLLSDDNYLNICSTTAKSAINEVSTNTANNANFTLEFNSSDNTWKIKSVSNNTYYFQYNTSSPRYTIYTGSQKNASLYKKEVAADPSILVAPQFSYPTGTYNNDLSVEITCSTAGAEIYYTTDGENYFVYNGAVNVSATTTIEAYSKLGNDESDHVSATYTMVCATPTFSIAAGTYIEAQAVEITTATTGAKIYYTTDGTNPSAESTLYSAPVSVESSLTLKAVAIKEGYTHSNYEVAEYVIDANGPIEFNFTTNPAYGMVATTDGNFYYDAKNVCVVGNVKITLDGKYRVWESKGGYDLRLYVADNNHPQTATIKVEAPAGYALSEIEFTGSKINFTPNTGELSSNTWTGLSPVVLFTTDAISQVSKITVTCKEASNSLTEVTTEPLGINEITDLGGGYYAENIVLCDALAYTNDKEVLSEKIEYNRSYNDITTWKPWYVPFAISADKFEKVLTLKSATYDGTATVLEFETLEATATLDANTSYFVLPKNNVEAYSVTDTDLYPAANAQAIVGTGYTLVGIYTEKTDMEGVYALASDGNLHPGSATAVLKPFRFYLTVPAQYSQAPIRMIIDGEEDVNGIESILDGIMEQNATYNLQGVRVDNPTTGVYIINGKKTYIK